MVSVDGPEVPAQIGKPLKPNGQFRSPLSPEWSVPTLNRYPNGQIPTFSRRPRHTRPGTLAPVHGRRRSAGL